ncbi:VOC family protein [Planctomicrobium sp. SH661]|uniref:VOC family protein n=1 Tax=Planctomicrobium sp. SH661 TaxID=3448124 RepID=UPI003F5C04E3
MSHNSHIPPGFHTVNPYLVVSDCAKLIDFLKVVFDAEEIMRMPGENGGVRHAEVRIGDSPIEMGDANSQWSAMPGSLHIYVTDTDAAYVRALAAGAELLAEPQDQFYGERSASVRDPVGNVWHIATKTEDVSEEEMKRRAAELAAKS